METPFLPNGFIFNKNFDTRYLRELYDDDYPYIEEIFATTLENIDPDLDSFKTGWTNDDPLAVKTVIHKMKAGFGFVGLPVLQELCQQYEDQCLHAASLTAVTPAAAEMWQILNDHKALLQSEYARLVEYNEQYS